MKLSKHTLGRLVLLAMGGIALITTATCDPFSGALNIYRDDDFGYYDGYYYEEIIIYDDCFFDCW